MAEPDARPNAVSAPRDRGKHTAGLSPPPRRSALALANMCELSGQQIPYVERSSIGQRLITLDADSIEFVRHLKGERMRAKYALNDIDANFERLKVRNRILVIAPIVTAILFAAIAIVVVWLGASAQVVAFIAAFYVISSVALAFRGLKRIEMAKFRFDDGSVAFDVLRGEAEQEEFENFVAAISDRILAMKRKACQPGGASNAS